MVTNNTKEDKRACSKATEDTPDYGSKEYWDQRYKNQGNEPDENAPLPGHEWYFSYDELQPLLMPLAQSVLEEMKDASSLTVLEIGCGDRPIGHLFAQDIRNQSTTSIFVTALCTDYSAAVIDILQSKQNQVHDPPVSKKLKLEHDSATSDTKISSSLQVKYEVIDATKLPYHNKSIHIVMEKGTLDAAMSDKANGLKTCHAVMAETARVLVPDGALVLVSHMNAHDGAAGMAWFQDVVLQGLLANEQWFWEVQVHGNSDAESSDEEADSSDECDGEGETNTDAKADDDESNHNEADQEPKHDNIKPENLGPAVYIIYKRKSRPIDHSNNEESSEDEDLLLKQVTFDFFSY